MKRKKLLIFLAVAAVVLVGVVVGILISRAEKERVRLEQLELAARLRELGYVTNVSSGPVTGYVTVPNLGVFPGFGDPSVPLWGEKQEAPASLLDGTAWHLFFAESQKALDEGHYVDVALCDVTGKDWVSEEFIESSGITFYYDSCDRTFHFVAVILGELYEIRDQKFFEDILSSLKKTFNMLPLYVPKHYLKTKDRRLPVLLFFSNTSKSRRSAARGLFPFRRRTGAGRFPAGGRGSPG